MTNIEIPTTMIPLLAAVGPGLVVAVVVLVRRTTTSFFTERTARRELLARIAAHPPVLMSERAAELPSRLRPAAAAGE